MEEARGDMFAPQKRSMMMSPVNPPVNGGMAYSSSKRGKVLCVHLFRYHYSGERKEAAARDQRLMVDILEDLTSEAQTNSVYSNKEWIVADWGSAEWLNIFGRLRKKTDDKNRETQDRDKNAAKLDKRVSEMNKGLRLAVRGTADPKKRQGWCAWPETDNTWELLENLQSISASIDAFEKILRPGKAGKKRKGQYEGCNSQLNKKKNQQGLTSTSDDASEKTDPTLNEL
ncbi:hypothetical protein F2Q68_00016687 [Brassica cretica]|uniref:Uncharacterized protein n=1 Tax=Brassica cretica TaxID=69181 RepID=A0A8S9H830_BRACR|nr:hypothetical protein F2Q68_00016687 [Brassica cretica]